MKQLLHHVRAYSWLLTLCISCLLSGVVIIVTNLIARLTVAWWHPHLLLKLNVACRNFYLAISNTLFGRALRGCVTVEAWPDNLKADGTYLVIANHQAWSDIILLQLLLGNKIPRMVFFMKKVLVLSIPVVGFAAYLIGYPLLGRYTRKQIKKNPALLHKDKATTAKTCEQLKQLPSTLMVFVEGTRYSAAKHAKQQSPYTHLLKPKGGAIATIVSALHPKLDGILDVTIDYHGETPSFMQLLRGDVTTISLHATLTEPDFLKAPPSDHTAFRTTLQHYLNERWQFKSDYFDGADT